MKKILIILGITILSLVATVVSVKYERMYSGVTGNVCDVSADNPNGFCYEDLPKGGFPFAYLYDQGGITMRGALEIFDSFYVTWFITDIVFYFLLFSLILIFGRKITHALSLCRVRKI